MVIYLVPAMVIFLGQSLAMVIYIGQPANHMLAIFSPITFTIVPSPLAREQSENIYVLCVAIIMIQCYILSIILLHSTLIYIGH